MICANVLPKQTMPIPWGWENKTIDSKLCEKETYVVKPKGDLEMPDLCSYFDWNNYLVEGSPRSNAFGTRNYKSIFTTATRLLGFERLLIERPLLGNITYQYAQWNRRLLQHWPAIKIFFIGDDFAGNSGLFMHPNVWRSWLLPEYERLVEVAGGRLTIFHSDGDIFDILDDLVTLKINAISYEPVARMQDLGTEYKGVRLIPVEDQGQTHPNSMAMQR